MSFSGKEWKLVGLLATIVFFSMVSSAFCETLTFPDEYSAIVEAINAPQPDPYAVSAESSEICSVCHGAVIITNHHDWIPAPPLGDPNSPYNPYCPDPPPVDWACAPCHYDYDENCQRGWVVRIGNACVACHAMSPASHDSVLVLPEQCAEIAVPGGCFLQPDEMIQNLINTVLSLNLQNGISNSLDAKLDTALSALDDVNSNNDVAAVNSLNAFINAVEAQRGNQISNEDADAMIAAVQDIISALLNE